MRSLIIGTAARSVAACAGGDCWLIRGSDCCTATRCWDGELHGAGRPVH